MCLQLEYAQNGSMRIRKENYILELQHPRAHKSQSKAFLVGGHDSEARSAY
jgi:hypothetical protein